MTEDSWLICTDLEAMLDFLEGRSTDRRLRLFACACYRRAWHLLTDDRSRQALEVVERFADGLAGNEELATARLSAEMLERKASWTAGPEYHAAALAVCDAAAAEARPAGAAEQDAR